MKSLIIELTRTGVAHSTVLSLGNQYLALCGTNPEQTFTVNCYQQDLYDQIKNLRYSNGNPAATQKAIAFCEKLVTDIFRQTKYLENNLQSDEPLHIRLVVNPLELAQLPFEFVRIPLNTDQPATGSLLADAGKIISFTREVRQESEARYEWPAQPRILFAWAQPSANVPYAEQKVAFEEILMSIAKPKKDYAEPIADLQPLFTEIPHASVHAIRKKLKEAIAEKKPYTHINILAHGISKESMSGYDFDLVLCTKDTTNEPDIINSEVLIELFTGDKDHIPVVVSLSACDSANVGNVIHPAGSLIYQLHNAGIPCVFASQFPLTQKGSITMIKKLYGELVEACDPRTALYQTRIALKEENSHDWASLVAYSRFPEDIEEQVAATRLKKVFSSMKVANSWTDHVFRNWKDIKEEKRQSVLSELERRLDNSIRELTTYVSNGKSSLPNSDLQCEHMGLLASAHKRKAEHLWRLAETTAINDTGKLLLESTAALMKAKEYYRLGFEAGLESHWNAVQFLSLTAVLSSSLEEHQEIWYVAKYTAELALKKDPDDFWALGSLAELYLLQPLLKQTFSEKDNNNSAGKAVAYIEAMKKFDASFNSYRESMVRQLDRYTLWWPKVYHDTFPASIKETARNMIAQLPSVQELLTG